MNEIFKQVLHSLRHKKSLNILMLVTISIGIALMTTMMTIAYQESKIPLAYKSDQVNLVLLDNREAGAEQVEFYRMPRTTYKDVENIFKANLATKSLVRFWNTNFIAEPESLSARPMRLTASATNHQVFNFLDIPFIYGAAWSLQAEENTQAVIVIDKVVNDKLFAGENSVGKQILIDKKPMTIVGVMDMSVHPKRFQDRSYNSIRNDQAYVPYTYALANNFLRQVNLSCPTSELSKRTQFRTQDVSGLKTSECGFENLWVEFSNKTQADNFQNWLENYASKQKETGRFSQDKIVYLPNINKLSIVYGDNFWTQTLVMMSYLLFGVCIINTSGIMLAKFQSKSKLVSLYRALGATKAYIVRLHLIEVLLVSIAGIIAGLLLAKFGLHIMFEIARYQTDYMGDIEQHRKLYALDWYMVAKATLITISSVLAAGLYPIWRISSLAPASQLRGS